MHGQSALLWHVIVHDSKDTLFHLASVLAAKNHHLPLAEVHVDRGLGAAILGRRVSLELTGVHDGEVGPVREGLLQSFLVVSEQHLLHEKSMIRPGADDSAGFPVLWVVTRVPIDYENLNKA